MNNSLLELEENYSLEYLADSATLVTTKDADIKVRTNSDCSPLIRFQNIVLKRVLDLIVSSVAILFLLSWLLPILALLIKIDSRGPVFFIQKRNKKGGKIFQCLKLRTMIVNVDSDTLTATLNDKRITSLGKFLRRSHLDEIPQFINVLIGDMSIIGPRPHMYFENVKYNALYHTYNERHTVKPGITGLAQSLGYHGPISDITQLEKKIAYDIFYIKHWSLAMDIKILIHTIKAIFEKFAYPLKS